MQAAESKICQNCKLKFTIEPDDFAFYEKMQVPSPTWCPECREQRRLTFRNERMLYHRNCNLCGEKMISLYTESSPVTVYCLNCYHSDKWDPHAYGRDYDFSKNFFEQFAELERAVPRPALYQENVINSEWVNFERNAKNCYLDVGGEYTEDCAYTTYGIHAKSCFDSYWVWNSERVYEALKCGKSYKICYSFWCFDCHDAWFSYDCAGCSNIIGCAGLRRKNYYIFNEPVTKSEFDTFVRENLSGSWSKMQELYEKSRRVWVSVPHRNAFIVRSVNCTGNFIEQSKNVKNCWQVENAQDARYLYIAANMKNCYDAGPAINGELTYEVMSGAETFNVKFSYLVWNGVRNVEYSSHIWEGNNLFGCTGLKKGSYCILNKRYSKDDFEILRRKIISAMMEKPYVDRIGRVYGYGEFFPPEFSVFGYNETVAHEYFPLLREQAAKSGYKWSEERQKTPYQFSDYKIPDDIRTVSDDVTKKILKCEKSGKAFRIIPAELVFYRSMGLPIPRYTPLERHRSRISSLFPLKLFHRSCQCAGAKSENGIYTNTAKHFHAGNHCSNEFETSYAPDRPEIVYCEQCYQSEVA